MSCSDHFWQQHRVSVSFPAHVTGFDPGALAPLKRSYESAACCLRVTAQSQKRRLCVSVLRELSPDHPSLRAEVVFVSVVCCCRVCQSARSQARCTEEVMGSRWENIPPLPKKV